MMSNFLSPFHSLHLFQLFLADGVYKKSLEDACYFWLQSVSLVFQQFQADCVYKKSLEDACYFLLQSVSLVFYSFPLFQLFR